MNVLTFDIEEWFHLLDFDPTRTDAEWGKYETRIYENVDRIIDILDRTDTKATFFIIGWIARKYPEVVRKISGKYQIGTHTMNHQLVWQQSKDDFRKELDTSVKLLQDISGQPVECFRAPGFSIRESESWAFDIMYESGIKYDCSIFPAKHAHGGMPSYGTAVPSIIRYGGTEIKEFPVSPHYFLGKPVIFSGGGYFRLAPYGIIRKWAEESDRYLLTYIHPRDLDYGQPVLKGLPLKRRFKSYVGLKGAASKLEKFLTDFNFNDIKSASEKIDWDKAPIVSLD